MEIEEIQILEDLRDCEDSCYSEEFEEAELPHPDYHWDIWKFNSSPEVNSQARIYFDQHYMKYRVKLWVGDIKKLIRFEDDLFKTKEIALSRFRYWIQEYKLS